MQYILNYYKGFSPILLIEDDEWGLALVVEIFQQMAAAPDFKKRKEFKFKILRRFFFFRK